jgi:cation-transporting ATPase E
LVEEIQGLTESEARERRERGLGNNAEVSTGRTYRDIARANLFTTYNNILFAIGVALVALGRYWDAATSVGIGLVNALISTAQEVRAKRQLDRIALLSTPTVAVVREGRERGVDPAELVVGDVVRVAAGDQVVVDGPVVGEGSLEMDESLLTGEPELVPKRVGDRLFSGSFCVTGAGYMEAEKVGAESFANRLTATARGFAVTKTPLQRRVDLVVRFVMLIVTFMSVIILVSAVLEGLPDVRLVQIAAGLRRRPRFGRCLGRGGRGGPRRLRAERHREQRDQRRRGRRAGR